MFSFFRELRIVCRAKEVRSQNKRGDCVMECFHIISISELVPVGNFSFFRISCSKFMNGLTFALAGRVTSARGFNQSSRNLTHLPMELTLKQKQLLNRSTFKSTPHSSEYFSSALRALSTLR